MDAWNEHTEPREPRGSLRASSVAGAGGSRHVTGLPSGTGAGAVDPPRSWREPETHFLRVLEEPWYSLIVELQSALTVLTTEFWSARHVCCLHLPITTCSISSPIGRGSDSMPVEVEIGGVKTCLADSMQFMLEFGCRLAPDGCYYLMPSFRGEEADATHLSQFFHSEAEIVGGLDDIIDTVEAYLHFLAGSLLDRLGAEIEAAAGDVRHIERLAEGNPVDRLTLDEAVNVLGENPRFARADPRGWRTLTREGERALIREASDGFVWVTEMDHLSVPFYQAFADADRRKALNADLLFGIGETVGAGERHTTGDEVREALAMHEVAPEAYTWYVTLKELHPLRTAGFGMGVERLLLWVLRHDDIRDIPLLLRFNEMAIQP